MSKLRRSADPVVCQLSRQFLAVSLSLFCIVVPCGSSNCAYAAGNPTSLQQEPGVNIQPATPASLPGSANTFVPGSALPTGAGTLTTPANPTRPSTLSTPANTPVPGRVSSPVNTALPGSVSAPAGPQSPAQAVPDLRPTIPPTGLPASQSVSLTGTISVDQALNQTLIYGPRAASARSLVGISRAAITQAKVYPNPALEFDNGYAELSYRFGIALPIEPPWKMILRIAAAKALVGTANIQMEQSLWLLRADIRRAYTELVIAQESLKMMRDMAELTRRLSDVANKRFQSGDVAKLDVYKAQLAAAQADVDANQAERRVIQAREQLNIIMGSNEDNDIVVPSLSSFRLRAEHNIGLLPDLNQPLVPESQFITAALRDRLDIKLVKQELKATEAGKRLAIGNIMPTGQIAFGYDRQINNPPDEANLNRMYLMGSMPIPVTDFQQGELARIKATMRSLNFELVSQENIVRGQVALAYRKVLNARENIRRYQDSVLEQSQKVAELGRQSYQLGQTDITSALNAQQANIQVRNLYLTEVMNYELAFTDLEQSVGHILQ